MTALMPGRRCVVKKYGDMLRFASHHGDATGCIILSTDSAGGAEKHIMKIFL